MFRFSRVLLGSLLILSAFAAPVRGQRVADPGRYELVHLDSSQLRRSIDTGRLYWIPLEERPIGLELDPVELEHEDLLIRFQGRNGPGTLPLVEDQTFRGTEVGSPGTEARLSIVENGVRGYIRRELEWVFIEPAPAAERVEGDEHRVYTDADLDPDFHGACDAHLVENEYPAAHVELVPDSESEEPPIASDSTYQAVEVAVDCDHDFYLIHGSDSTAQVQAILNEVDGIFRTELGLAVTITSVNVWTDLPDPYTSTDSSTLLGEMRSYWNTNFTAVQRDLAHLFTGKDLDGSTIGVGYVGVLCSQTFGYALSQELGSSALMPILVAHEMGHNLGSGHDATPSDPKYIMYPSLGSANLDQYSADSKTSIGAQVAGSVCLSTLEVSDTPSGGGGGGGGGGPVDPFTLILLGVGGMLDRTSPYRGALIFSVAALVLVAHSLDPKPWVDLPRLGLEWWRPLTGQFFHGSSWHALHDLALFLPLGLLHESRVGPRRFARDLVLLLVAVPIGLRLCHDDWESYRGLSGVAYGLVPLVILDSRRDIDPVGASIVAVLVTKSWMELTAGGWIAGGPMCRGLMGIQLLAGSHLGGLAAGLSIAVLSRARGYGSSGDVEPVSFLKVRR